jgi:hypothetical protein
MNKYLDIVYGYDYISISPYTNKVIHCPILHLNKKERLLCNINFIFRITGLVLLTFLLIGIAGFFHDTLLSLCWGFLIGEIVMLIYLCNEEKFSLKEMLENKKNNKQDKFSQYWWNEYYRSNGFQYSGETDAN